MRRSVEIIVKRTYEPDEEAMIEALRLFLNAKVIDKGAEKSA